MTHEKCTDYKTIFTRIDDMIKNYECSDKRVLEYIYQELQNEGIGWIPVSERLPENTNLVIIFDRFRKLGQYISSTNGWYDEDSNLEFPNENVTHWQPLPAPPEQD